MDFNQNNELEIDKELYRQIDDMSIYSLTMFQLEIDRRRIEQTKREEELKLSYKVWLAQKKQELELDTRTRKLISENAKEDAIIAKYRDEYLKRNKDLIDTVYQKSMAIAILRTIENMLKIRQLDKYRTGTEHDKTNS